MFRQIKEMKAMLEGAPEMTEPALPMSAQAQRLATAQAAVRQAWAGGTRTGYADGGYAQAGDTDEPIAGVSLEQYAAISKYAAAFGHDPGKMAEFAAARGFSELAWRAAVAGWNARLRADAAVARRFNLRYRES
ncbi:MAG TPA: hypothetical protein VIX15_01195 [Streptosporangiaceae bacterium]